MFLGIMVYVTCPVCKKEKHVRGERHFICCNGLHSIAKNINKPPMISSEDSDLEDFKVEADKKVEEKEEDFEHTCGTNVTKEQKYCTGCGAELDWE